MSHYTTKKLEELEVGDICLREITIEEEVIQYKFLVLNDFILFNLDTQRIEGSGIKYLGPKNEKVIFIANIYNLKPKTIKEYVWMGIVHRDVKILLNLKTLVIEWFNTNTDEWEEIPDKYVKYENQLSDIICMSIPRRASFKLNLSNLNLKIKECRSLRYKNYYNFLLGTEDDYVFNQDNELELIEGDK